ncbi:rhodanese-like domain-containing protein [bacterium]|nr:rhodanese-like domain-containing protein [bacterium]
MENFRKKNDFTGLKSLFGDFLARIDTFFSAFRVSQGPLQPPHIGENTKISTLLMHYPSFEKFLESRFNITLQSADRARDFRQLCEHHQLAPARVVFMEFQLSERSPAKVLGGTAFRDFLSNQHPYLLDVREPWEWKMGMLPGARPMDMQEFEKLLAQAPRNTPLAVYCHYGIRSLDAAVYLTDRGFENVVALAGGLEAWSLQIDPDFPRYTGHPC